MIIIPYILAIIGIAVIFVLIYKDALNSAIDYEGDDFTGIDGDDKM